MHGIGRVLGRVLFLPDCPIPKTFVLSNEIGLKYQVLEFHEANPIVKLTQ